MSIAERLNILRPIINVNMCFFGIELCWALLMANISTVLIFLGAMPATLAYLWLAPPLIGLIMQPVVGQISDNTVSRYGKRIPYMFVGLILGCLLCFLLPFAKSLWLGTILLWLLLIVVNVAHQPMRALAVDIIPHSHLTFGFAIQMCLIGAGSIVGTAMPYLLNRFSTISIQGAYQPVFITLSLFVAGILALMTGLWTCFTIKEASDPTPTVARERISVFKAFKDVYENTLHMPKILKQISVAQFLTWIGLFTTFAYLNLSIAQTMFGLPPGADINHNAFNKALMVKATSYNSLCFLCFQISSFIVALALPGIVRFINRKTWLSFSLVLGGIGLLSTFITPAHYIFTTVALGVSWGSGILYLTMIATNLPKEKMGLYMGLFNIANTASQIFTGLILGPIIKYFLHNQVHGLVAFSGLFLLLAAIFNQRIEDKGK